MMNFLFKLLVMREYKALSVIIYNKLYVYYTSTSSLPLWVWTTNDKCCTLIKFVNYYLLVYAFWQHKRSLSTNKLYIDSNGFPSCLHLLEEVVVEKGYSVSGSAIQGGNIQHGKKLNWILIIKTNFEHNALPQCIVMYWHY